VVAQDRGLLTRHAIRAADAVQLASCLYVRKEVSDAVPLVVFDSRLAKAGVDERVPVIPRRRGKS
jgi:predicted nucleic acid-binding protein